MPYSCCRAARRSRICARTVTSSAVVGSSASKSFGLHASAMAIIARWRCPPDNWCGYDCARRSGSGMPVLDSSATAADMLCARAIPILSCNTSATWSPTVNSGFRAVIGSWKIIAISRPRIPRNCCSEMASRSNSPAGWANLAEPLHCAFMARRRRLSAVTVLPEPDSPTRASFSPGAIEKSIPLTTSTPPNATRRPVTCSNPVMRGLSALAQAPGPPCAGRAHRAGRRP